MLSFGLVVYIRIRRHWVSVRALPRRGEPTQIEGTARVAIGQAISGAEQVVAFGDEVSASAVGQDVTIHDAFCHPRVLISSIDTAQLVIGEFLRRACGGKRPLLRFRMVIHLPDESEGGLTDVEERALTEIGLRLGAGRVVISQETAELSDEQVVALVREGIPRTPRVETRG